MIIALTNIIKFITDPKNTRMFLFAGIVLFAFLFLRQCDATEKAKEQVKIERQDKQRIQNNWDASLDTLKQFKLNAQTHRAQIRGYEITVDELNTKYKDLLAEFEIEKNRPPKVIIKTEYVIKEVIKEVPIYVTIDSTGSSLEFEDSVSYNENNWRKFKGKIPFKIDTLGEEPKVIPGNGDFSVKFGMNLNLGLFKDSETKQIMIKADSDYPGIDFTSITGANILENSENKKAVRALRKRFGIGVSIGYGFSINGAIAPSPYIGIGLNYQPKFLQW